MPAYVNLRLWLLIALAASMLALAAACGGDNSGKSVSPGGSLTDPRRVPYATPWAQPPEPIFLKEGAFTPLVPEGQQGQQQTPVSGETYKVKPGDSPSTICPNAYEELMKLNNITDPSKLQVGQELKLPASCQ